ncbi:MAG: SOS response-associated peptidase, partial [Myxococcales bacterium]|nr:SOS response-associated peptidase [Myxococcales bacterium]
LSSILVDPNVVSLSQVIDIADVFLNRLQVPPTPMCGRYTLTSPDELVQEFGLGELPFSLAPRYNVAPSNVMPVVVNAPDTPSLIRLRWGLVPGWVTPGASTKRPINARSETVHEKPLFRDAFERRRCLVCADGLYEWRRQGTRRTPYFMHRRDSRPVGLAGIWERHVSSEGVETDTFAVLTCDANELMSPIHHRMPVIVAPEDRERWLDSKICKRRELEDILAAPGIEDYEIYQVSERVNAVANDSPACLKRGPDQHRLFDSSGESVGETDL